ncbi:hypothetical protein Pint_10992 [Pistacia integerrima]|uniref:Uncharacterized protein n=1 Tax=Pistacia integerrima TaxID=434235 RepID=A0ACC0XGQ5_9ROSI|nr:hypothetical protein Pint_10992 [Pistacia integerrima]
MDVKKLTIDASMHVALNKRLPLRVVVLVLFFEKVTAAARVHAPNNNPRDALHTTTNTDEEWEKAAVEDDRRSLKKQMSRMKVKYEEFQKNGKLIKKNSKNSKSVVRAVVTITVKEYI